MTAELELEKLLTEMSPELREGEYVFSSVTQEDFDDMQIEPVGWFREVEGISLILDRAAAQRLGLKQSSAYRMISLFGGEVKGLPQDVLDRRSGPSPMMFGPRDKTSEHTAQSMRWKIKLISNDEPGQRFGELARESHEIYGTALGATTLQIGQTSPSKPRLRYPLDRRLK